MRRYRDFGPKDNRNNEQRMLMDKIQSLSFAVLETGLYLDGHPNNRMALAYYQKVKQQLDALTAEYEMKFAPLSGMGHGGNEREGWQWVKQPWPWELHFPEMGDNPDVNATPTPRMHTREMGKEA